MPSLADEIGLDLSDFPLANALGAKQPPRFVLRIDLAKQPNQQGSSVVKDKQGGGQVNTLPNGTATSQSAKKPASPNLSLISGQSAGSDTSSLDSLTGSASFSKDKKLAPGALTNNRQMNKQSTPSATEKAKNFLNFSSAKSPRMFFDGISKPGDHSSHHTSRFLRGRRQRKRSTGSGLPGRSKKNGTKDKVELSTQELAPGILKVFGDHVSPGSNYKSVRATDMTTAEEIVKQALERYSLMDHNSSDYVLCDVVGYFAKKPGSSKKSSNMTDESDKWITEYSRVIGDKEKPLVLQQLWKPDAGFSRRFELHKRSDTEQSSFFKARGSMAVMKAASIREVKGAAKVKDFRRGTGDSDTSSLPASIDEHFQYCSEEGGSSGRTSVAIGSLQAPVDTQYLLLLRGFNNIEDILFHRLDEQVTVLGCHDNQLEEGRADIVLDDPDLLHQHCTLTKMVEARGSDVDLLDYDVGFVVNLEPHGEACVRINGLPITESVTLQPGDLVSVGEHYLFLYKDPLQVADRSLRLKWVNSLAYLHEHGPNLGSPAGFTVNGVSNAHNRLNLAYRPEEEDRILEEITRAGDPHLEGYKLTPTYLFLMCIEHSALHHSELQTRKLLLKIANTIQTMASDLTTEISNSIEKNTTPDKAVEEVLPQFKPIIFWQANCLEMFNFLQQRMSHYVGQNPKLTDETLKNADEELLMFLEEVIIYTFQQTVYHLTKVLYIALPAILDTNPFQQLDDDDGGEKKPQEVETVVNIFQTMHDIMREQLSHQEIVHQLFAYLFFFANASLFNILMERGTGGNFYRWAKGAQIRGNLDALEAWAVQVELQNEANEYLQKLSTAADLLATPKVQLLQADWTSIRRDFPALNAAQVQQILSEYQLGPGKSRPRGWFPPPEEVEPALRTSDILVSFADHPPLNLPRSEFVVDLERGPHNAAVFEHLQALGQDIANPPPPVAPDKNKKTPVAKTVSSPFPAQRRNHAATRSGSAGGRPRDPSEVTTPGRPLRNSTCGGSPLPLNKVHKLDSRSSSLPLLSMTDENENETDHLTKNGVGDGDASRWVRVDLGLENAGTHGLSVLPVETSPSSLLSSPDSPRAQDDDVLRQLSSNLEGMRDANDGQDDVFIVELEKNEAGIGLGLIDGLFTPLKSPGIYVRTLVPGGPAVKDGRLRIGDRILAVNGTSLVGADYQSAMLHIRNAGQRLSFLVAKSDIHVAMQITASSC